METLQLIVSARAKDVKAKQILLEKSIPAEYYGKGIENLSLQVNASEFRRLFRKAGYNTVISLEFDKKALPVLVHEISVHPLTDEIIHIDFKAVKMDEEVETTIPLEFVGTSIAVKDYAGTFVKNMNEVEVKCLPQYLVSAIEVDISTLIDFNSQISIKDLKVPEGIEIMHEEDESVCTVVPPAVEEEQKPAEAAAVEGAAPAEAPKEDKKE